MPRFMYKAATANGEVIQGENIWLPLEAGELIGVDWRMKLLRTTGHRHLSVVN